MRSVVASVDMVAYCGLYCGGCGAYLKEKCNGCQKNAKAAWCKIRSCCMGKGIASCAECNEFADPKACKKFNNIMSKVFALLFKSNRPACVAQIKELGLEGHAKKMAELKKHSLKP
jgi:hypothetical protein